ncbi:MAG: hypothetical protein Q8P01_05505 [bacterium]|nr:hypothetical protein [bacterium]
MTDHRDKTERILELLDELPSFAGEIMEVFFDSYPSRRRGRLRRSSSVARDTPLEEERQRFYSFLALLKKQGFIERKERTERQSKWKITKCGLSELFAIREKKKYSPRRVSYEPEKDSTVRVVVFDVPEHERYKRVWLRAALLSLEFSLCQQSVWVGKSKIPQKFLEDLRDREMLSYVQIFEVSKTGSLERMNF